MADIKLLRWRCRRGMKELDKLLEDYLLNHFETSSPADQDAFQTLLTLPDPLLYGYLFQGLDPEENSLQNIVNQITHLKKPVQ